MRSFPVYITPWDEVLSPDGLEDLPHEEYWEREVAGAVAGRLGVDRQELVNLPYCIRRARLVEDVVYYGEADAADVVVLLRDALGRPSLRVVYDEHEVRSEHDVAAFGAATANLQRDS